MIGDPTVHAVTGAPCKGKLAARALAVLVLDPHLSQVLRARDPNALAQAERALAPFGWPDRNALAHKLDVQAQGGRAMPEKKTEQKKTDGTDRATYNVLVDYNTRVELGAASLEMRMKFEAAKKEGKAFIERVVCGVNHRVTVETKTRPRVRADAPARAKAVASVTLERESEIDAAAESELGLRWPHCNCMQSTLWSSRKVDGRWTMGGDEPEMEQRTCLACGASKSREAGR